MLRRGDFCYEVHQAAGGVDLYRDAVSWSPYASLGHAYAAGAALARLHLAAADFARPARPPAVLMNSCQVITAPDPLDAARALVAARPALAAYLAERRWQEDFGEVLVPLIGRAAPELAALPPQWAHGDWHPSNLTWTSAAPDAQVAGIFDFGLANRTFAVHDLALALERAVVSWLDLPETGTASADLAAAARAPGRLPDGPAADRGRSHRAAAGAARRARRVRAVRSGLLHQRGDLGGQRRPGL